MHRHRYTHKHKHKHRWISTFCRLLAGGVRRRTPLLTTCARVQYFHNFTLCLFPFFPLFLFLVFSFLMPYNIQRTSHTQHTLFFFFFSLSLRRRSFFLFYYFDCWCATGFPFLCCIVGRTHCRPASLVILLFTFHSFTLWRSHRCWSERECAFK